MSKASILDRILPGTERARLSSVANVRQKRFTAVFAVLAVIWIVCAGDV